MNNITTKKNRQETSHKFADRIIGDLVDRFDRFADLKLLENKKLLYVADDVLGTREQIHASLQRDVLVHSEHLDRLYEKIDAYDQIIADYKSLFLEDQPRSSKIKENRFYLPKEYDLTEEQMIARARENGGQGDHISYSRRKKKNLITAAADNNLKKTLGNLIFTGFDLHELNDLPGLIEAPQFLISVSSKFRFKESFLKYWIPFIRSEASCAILVDSFWWFYLKYFHSKNSKNRNSVSAAAASDTTTKASAIADIYKYYCRIADSFVALFMSVDSSLRDRFFQLYADFLPQAIYLVFYQAFPDSRLQFNDTFKQELCNVIVEWVLGIKPVPECYSSWKINSEIDLITSQQQQSSATKVKSANKLIHKINNLEKMLSHLGGSSGGGDGNESTATPTPRVNTAASSSIHSASHQDLLVRRKSAQSHNLGEGAHLERHSFNLKGQSILISHYMKIHHLQENQPQGFSMSRTQIIQQPPKTAPTYRDVIYDSLQRTKSLEDEFRKIKITNEQELKKLEKERRKTMEEISRLKRSNSARVVSKNKVKNVCISPGSQNKKHQHQHRQQADDLYNNNNKNNPEENDEAAENSFSNSNSNRNTDRDVNSGKTMHKTVSFINDVNIMQQDDDDDDDDDDDSYDENENEKNNLVDDSFLISIH